MKFFLMGKTKLQCLEMHTCVCQFLDHYEVKIVSLRRSGDSGMVGKVLFLDSNTGVLTL